MSFTTLAVVVAMSLTGLSDARAGDKPRVGIAVGVKVNVSDIEARLLSDSLGGALRETFDVTVVSGEDAERRLPEGGLPDTCIAETACLRSAADALGVETLLVLVAVRVGESIQVDATVFDTKTGSTRTRPPVRMTDRERQWDEAFLAAAKEILPGAPLRAAEPPPDTGKEVDVGPSPPPAVTRSSPGFLATRTTLSWVLGGATVIAVGSGTYFGVRALRRDNERPSRCPSDNPCTAARVSTASFIAAGLLGAGFVYTFLFTEKEISTSARAFGLQPGPGDIGVALGGRF